jgi:hypothetical protein
MVVPGCDDAILIRTCAGVASQAIASGACCTAHTPASMAPASLELALSLDVALPAHPFDFRGGTKRCAFALQVLGRAAESAKRQKTPADELRVGQTKKLFVAKRLGLVLLPRQEMAVRPPIGRSRLSDCRSSMSQTRLVLLSRPYQEVIGSFKRLSSRERPQPGLWVSTNLLALIRNERTGVYGRRKVFQHEWFSVVRCELLRRQPAHQRLSREMPVPWTSMDQLGQILRGHSLGDCKVSGSKASLYKATLQRLRWTEERLALFKVRVQRGVGSSFVHDPCGPVRGSTSRAQNEFMALRKTRLCNSRTHNDPICVACGLVRRGDRELFPVRRFCTVLCLLLRKRAHGI